MIISIGYYLRDNSQSKYFDTYEDAVLFIRKLEEVENSNFLHFDFYIYTGEEERIRDRENERTKK